MHNREVSFSFSEVRFFPLVLSTRVSLLKGRFLRKGERFIKIVWIRAFLLFIQPQYVRGWVHGNGSWKYSSTFCERIFTYITCVLYEIFKNFITAQRDTITQVKSKMYAEDIITL